MYYKSYIIFYVYTHKTSQYNYRLEMILLIYIKKKNITPKIKLEINRNKIINIIKKDS